MLSGWCYPWRRPLTLRSLVVAACHWKSPMKLLGYLATIGFLKIITQWIIGAVIFLQYPWLRWQLQKHVHFFGLCHAVTSITLWHDVKGCILQCAHWHDFYDHTSLSQVMETSSCSHALSHLEVGTIGELEGIGRLVDRATDLCADFAALGPSRCPISKPKCLQWGTLGLSGF